MSDLEFYLRNVSKWLGKSNLGKNGFVYTSMEDFVYKNGKLMGSRSIASDQYPKGKMGQCFRNAWRLLHLYPNLSYCEGYATGVIPVLHAWCIDTEGHVIDNTWKDGTEYYGVVFPANYVNKILSVRKCFGVIDNWENKWPLLQGEKWEV